MVDTSAESTEHLDSYGNSFTSYEVDRSIDDATLFFKQAFGEKGTPLQISKQIVETSGRVGILDAGCGTGHTAVSWFDLLRKEYPGAEVDLTALNDVDFSKRSADPYTREAIAERKIDYIISRKEDMSLPEGKFDIVHDLESIVHSRNPYYQLRKLLRVTAPGGHMFFTLGIAERRSVNSSRPNPLQSQDWRLKGLLWGLRKLGYTIEHKQVRLRGTFGLAQFRDFYHIVKPSVKK